MIAVETSVILKVLNIPNEDNLVNLFGEHSDRVLLWLKRMLDLNEFESDYPDISLPEIPEYKFSYCYYLLSITLDFINLKTLGQGIIKTTGIDSQSTELLSGNEIRAFKKDLEIRALEVIEDYLSDYGYNRLKELKYGSSAVRKHRTKATVI